MDIGQRSAQWALQQKNLSTLYFPELGSTSDFAKRIVEMQTPPSPFLVLTSHQVSGRGRGEKTWIDPLPGQNLLSTWAFPMGSTQPQPLSSALVGLAVGEALEDFWTSDSKSAPSSGTMPLSSTEVPSGTGVATWAAKAPNDIFLRQKKVAGILLESLALGPKTQWLFVGLGLNVLKNPTTDQPTICLADEFQITPERWEMFLNGLWVKLQIVAKHIQDGQSQHLSAKDEARLKMWLDRVPAQRGLDWKTLF